MCATLQKLTTIQYSEVCTPIVNFKKKSPICLSSSPKSHRGDKKQKIMKIPRRVNSISYWYFSKNSLPHWGILILDCMIILFSGLLSTYICEGGDGVAGYFWKWMLLWIASLPCYVIGMRVFHTYSGMMRFSSVSDFIRISGALFIGGALFGIVTFLLPEEELIPHIIWVKEILLQVVIALLLCCTMRIFVKAIYDVVFTGHNTERVFIYGVRQGGIALAESIRQQTPRKYIIKGFVSYEKNMQGKYLMGQKVYAPAHQSYVRRRCKEHPRFSTLQ